MSTLLRQIASDLFDLAVPRICSICGEPLGMGADTICVACRATFREIGSLVCAQCGAPVARGGGRRCPKCPAPPVSFDSARAVYLYRGQLAGAFHAFKYSHRVELGLPLAEMMFRGLERVLQAANAPEVLIPVPLHFSRRLTRGYNQSEILARELGRRAGIACVPDLLERVRRTPRQALLPPERRRANVIGAFEVTRAWAVRRRRVGLVDDVFTTGSTVNECARVLKEAGAVSVQVLALARA